jgi:hypothetical protein
LDYRANEFFPCEVIEAALAQVAGDKMNVTYQRGDLFDKRRKLVEAQAAYCTASSKGKIVSFSGSRFSKL